MRAVVYWNNIRKSEIKYPVGYLKGIEIVKEDFRTLIDKYKGDKVLLILDPPYLNTKQKTYSGSMDRQGFDELLDKIHTNYVLFSSNTSGFLEILAEREESHFKDFSQKEVKVAHRKDLTEYRDIMIYKKYEN